MLTRIEQNVGSSDPYADAILQLLGHKVFRLAIAGDGLNLEADDRQCRIVADNDCGEIAQEAAADVLALGLDAEGLGHDQVAVALEPPHR